jgi:cytochrome P450
MLFLMPCLGPIVRIGPNHLDIDTVEALVAIHRNPKGNVIKGEWYKTVDATSGDFSIQTVLDKKEHAFRRRVLAPAFSESALREQEPLIDNNVRTFLRVVTKNVEKDGWCTPFNFDQWITYYGFDFISDLSFGSSFQLLEDPEHRYLPNMLKWTSHFLYYVCDVTIGDVKY